MNEFIKFGDFFETTFLTGTFQCRNLTDEQEVVIKHVTFKCDAADILHSFS